MMRVILARRQKTRVFDVAAELQALDAKVVEEEDLHR